MFYYVWDYRKTIKWHAFAEAVGSCLGEIGPMDFSTTALQRTENALDSTSAGLFEDRKLQCVFIMLIQINTALTDNWWVYLFI